MKKGVSIFAVAVLSAAGSYLGIAQQQPAPAPAANMSFFITSTNPGNGANLGGIAGADAHCQALAAAVGAGNRTWRAYLSVSAADGQPAINARDRIGAGPWFNYNGVQVAASVADLHSDNNNLGKETSITERGQVVNGVGDTPNQHDILTGSQADGTAWPAGEDYTCGNWTSAEAAPARAWLGHHDRRGGGAAATSWNASHGSRGCGTANLQASGGAGYVYCFATN